MEALGPASGQASWITWHAHHDAELRSTIIRQVYSLFAKRKPILHDQGKLPDFIKRLEEALYKTAKSREEYADLSTLEPRLLEVVRRVMQKPNGHKPSNADQLLAALNQQASMAVPDAFAAQQPAGVQQQAPGGGVPQQPQQQPQQHVVVPQQPGQAAVGQMGQAGMLQPGGAVGMLQQQPPQQPQLGFSQQQAGGAAGMQVPGQQQPGGMMLAFPGGGAGLLPGQQLLNPAGGLQLAPQQQQQQQQQAAVPGQPNGTVPMLNGGMVPLPNQDPLAAAGMAAPGAGVAVAAQPGVSATDANGATPPTASGTPPAGGLPNQPFTAMLMGTGVGGGAGGAMMSNGAPVLLRGGGAGGGMVPCSLPLQTAGVLNGMVPTQLGGSMQLNPLLSNTQPQPLIKTEPGVGGAGAGGMIPMSATGGGGLLSADAAAAMVAAQQQQQQQQQAVLGGRGLPGMAGMGMTMIPMGDAGAGPAGQQAGGMSAVMLHQLQGPPQQQQQQIAALQRQQQFFQQQQQQQAAAAAGQPPGQQQQGGGLDLSTLPSLTLKQEPSAAPVGAMGGLDSSTYSLDDLLAGGNTAPDPQLANSNPEAARAAAAQQHEQRKQQILKQQRWLLFLRHTAKCPAGVDGQAQCQYGSTCSVAKQLWKHLIACKDQHCTYPRCAPSRMLLRHHQKCASASCPVCTPVKQYVSKQRAMVVSRRAAMMPPEQRQQYMLQLQQLGSSHPELLQMMEGGNGAAAAAGGSRQAAADSLSMHPSLTAVIGNAAAAGGSSGGSGAVGGPVLDPAAAAAAAASQGPAKRMRTLLQENMGTSLIEYFNQQQIKLHLEKLKGGAGTQPAKPSKVFTLDELPAFEDDNACKVCNLNRLTFEPPSLYCFLCGQRIKRNQVFYCTPLGHEIKANFCHTCFTDVKAERIDLEPPHYGVRKADLEKRKNDDEVEEGWVQCDRCECWVHQICGLFNKGRNDEDRGYLCPHCLLEGLTTGERKVPAERPQAMLSAKDLPRCELSDHLEKRLEAALADERHARAAALGVSPDQVPTAEGLTVRVVNNVVKKNEVKSRFYEAFRGDGYPEAFLYKQKVILLFQNIDGVDLCLYCLYMQEYGDDVPQPNRKMLYLSYLDSVKYFQPEDVVAAKRNVALRTFVYHDILVGYLQYMKARGYLAMNIWACPPLQGDDYILYCHPGKQKTPRSDRLREWYHTMLRQAKSEGIVTYVSNLHDTYFEGGKDHRLERPSITALPYFEGDYWPGEAENLLGSLGQEGAGSTKNSSKGTLKGGRTKGGSKGKRYGTGSTGEQLLGRLGEVIQGMKDDFIVVHLQEPCSFCREYVSGAHRHAHPNPPQKVVIKAERSFDGIVLDRPGGEASRTIALHRFQLCGPCLAREQGTGPAGVKPRGLPTGIDLRDLRPLPCDLIPPATDTVPQLENEFFDSRQAFLSLCQGNHYQFDTLRRAKHSSMMVLYHLHNPTAPAFSCTCNVCHMEIELGAGFRCTVCSDFDMCARCKASGLVTHPHPLTQHVRKIDEQHQRLTEKERQERSQQLQRTMWLLVHASACSDTRCPSSNCAKVKALFNHAMTCRVKIAGGCQYCRRMWALLQAHAKMCTASDCPVPRCRELRDLRRHQAARQEEKRRVAYRAMLNAQNAARTSGGPSSSAKVG